MVSDHPNNCPECGGSIFDFFDSCVVVNKGTENERCECENCHQSNLDSGKEIHCEMCNALIDDHLLTRDSDGEWVCPVCGNSICRMFKDDAPLSKEEFLKQMKDCSMIDDIEVRHIEMDSLMMRQLYSLGYGDAVDVFIETKTGYA